MPNAKDIKLEDRNIQVLVIGEPGTGKSIFASTFPTPGFVLDFDNGMLSYRGTDFDYETFETTNLGWIKFQKTYIQLKKDVIAGKYKTVILDSTTAMTDVAMAQAMAIDKKRTAEGGPIWNVHFMIVKNLIGPKLKSILSWPCNVVVTSHWNLKTDQATGAVLGAKPLITGDLAERIPGYCDEVYCAFTKGKGDSIKYKLRLVKRGFYGARSRISGKARLLPDEIPNDYNELMRYYKEAIAKEGGVN